MATAAPDPWVRRVNLSVALRMKPPTLHVALIEQFLVELPEDPWGLELLVRATYPTVDGPQATNLMSRPLRGSRRWKQSRELRDRVAAALVVSPHSAQLWRAMAMAEAASGNRLASRRAIDRALAIDPNKVLTLDLQAAVLAQEGQYTGSATAAMSLAQQFPAQGTIGEARLVDNWRYRSRLAAAPLLLVSLALFLGAAGGLLSANEVAVGRAARVLAAAVVALVAAGVVHNWTFLRLPPDARRLLRSGDRLGGIERASLLIGQRLVPGRRRGEGTVG